MKTITIKNCTIGNDIPKIAVPIVAKTSEQVLIAANTISTHSDECVDLVEWRADFFEQANDIAVVLNLLKKIRGILKDIPLIFTLRSPNEGGENFETAYPYTTYDRYYFALLKEVILSKNTDIIDVEILSSCSEELAQIAHENSIYVIMSAHDFHGTPPAEHLYHILTLMYANGADILKIAAMTRSIEDLTCLLTILSNYNSGKLSYAKKIINLPIVAIAMGKLGLPTRICGETFGSAISFGTLGASSAPGQIPAEKLKLILNIIHEC